ncbi:MAG: serine hydrolase domain-containing protein [Phenylobacterium sp.]|uniref:serine hydrolase domain-containing protein n=1 Tax=Phenylobacterium sp. TaxID=1871053 RepID=UPI00301A939D
MPFRRSLLALAFALGLDLFGQAAAAVPAPAGLEAGLDAILARGAPGVSVLVYRNGDLLYRMDRGRIALDERLPVASASKWMAAALVMTVVDEGRLSLDEPIGRRLPEFQGPSGEITLRQLLSYTAGQGSLLGMSDLLQDTGMTLAESAARIAGRPQADPPGTVFRYGGPSFQVVGALVEQATGQSWADLFEARIARPLGMTSTTWGHPLRPDLDPATVRNPNLQGGVYSTAADYGRFLGMVAGRGVLDGRRVLSTAAVAELETVQTAGKPMAYRPPGMSGVDAYDLGNWCEVAGADGACILASSPGAFGVYPWIDRRTGLYGLFFLKHQLPLVVDPIREARALILSAAP